MPQPSATHVDVLYLHHREQVRHSLSVLAKIAEHAHTKGEHPEVNAAGKEAGAAVREADNMLRVADKFFRDIGLERKDGIK